MPWAGQTMNVENLIGSSGTVSKSLACTHKTPQAPRIRLLGLSGVLCITQTCVHTDTHTVINNSTSTCLLPSLAEYSSPGCGLVSN